MLAQRKINPPPLPQAFHQPSLAIRRCSFFRVERDSMKVECFAQKHNIDLARYRTQSSLLGFQRADIHLLPIIQLSTQKSLFLTRSFSS